LIPLNTRRASTPPSSSAEAADHAGDRGLPAALAGICPLCHGAGYVALNVPVTDPNFGRLIACDCKIREIQERNFSELERMSNLESFASKTFDSFDRNITGAVEAFEAASRYARNPAGWLVLMGNYGCGKTHLAAAIAIYATRHLALKTLFTIVPDLLDHLRATYHPTSSVTYDERFEAVRTVPLLILDDLGAESQTSWAQEKLFQLINHRYNEQLPTVITSNVDLDRMDGRIRSRLLHTHLSRHVYVGAPDYRLRDVPARRSVTGDVSPSTVGFGRSPRRSPARRSDASL
jgi:DNA replication protein DnaC